MAALKGIQIHITGIVQGVGFRPFVYGLANRLALNGWVRNTSAGVDIQVEGLEPALQTFINALQNEIPPLARIDALHTQPADVQNFTVFEITHSEAVAGAFQPISPDVCICQDCLSEMLDPLDRRYLYPFINCTNCGPRFTIIKDIPYDRPLTTMAGFDLCPDCLAEYRNPLDRRFHAQPVACPVCGPQTWLEDTNQPYAPQMEEIIQPAAAIFAAQLRLAQGQILAIKGLGGFHLACDALNLQTVTELRRRKLRVDKPFALMMPDLATIREHCFISLAEEVLLESRQRPIVILQKRPTSSIHQDIAPGQDTLGVMLPYTPLHYLLFTPDPQNPGNVPLRVLVMTSGNLSEEPIVTENDRARQHLSGLADAFLMHNRPIHTRCDDAVMRIFQPTFQPAAPVPMRRARGYAPFPVQIPWETSPVLAVGAELKNTFCITRQSYAFLSHHIGDLENYETLRSFEEGVAHFERLFRIHPQALAYDLHPDYLATRYAQERACQENIPALGIQHHHAHIAACMAENGLDGNQPVIGVALDGAGYGEDGAIWGGEFLVANYTSYQRPVHLVYTRLPGGDKAARQPWRMALSWLETCGLSWEMNLPPMHHIHQKPEANALLQAIRCQLHNGLNAPNTSSAGRLFDAVASLVGIRQEVNYEAQAAIELETLAAAASDETAGYPMSIIGQSGNQRLDPTPLFAALLVDLRQQQPAAVIAARFHNGLAQAVSEVCCTLRGQFGINLVALSGGVWQNMTLLRKTLTFLESQGFKIYIHRQVPANDGGLALGQAVIASRKC